MNLLINKLKTGLKLTLLLISVVLLLPSEGLAWTDPVLTSRITTIKAVHVMELRTQINTKLGVCGQPAQAWTHGTLTPRSTTITKVDLDELRTGTTNLVNAYRVQQALPASPPVYTDPVITARTTSIKAVHFDELRTFVSGATCTPGCPAQALAWNVGVDACSASAPMTPVGASAAVSDIVLPKTGSASFTCNAGGVWAALPNAGATCANCIYNSNVWNNPPWTPAVKASKPMCSSAAGMAIMSLEFTGCVPSSTTGWCYDGSGDFIQMVCSC